MLYEQLCGRRPFTGNSVDEVVIRIAREDPALPSSYDPAVPRALEAICLRAIAKEPRSRFQTLAEFVEAMERVGGESVLATPEQVAEYVASLFPEKTDERRNTLRRAREADPSVPGAPMTPGRGLESTLPSPVRAYQPAQPAPQPALVAAAPAPAASAPPRRSPLPIILGVVALIAVGVGGFFALKRPQLSAVEQLALAEQAKGDERTSALVKLAAAPDVTEAQLARAGALLVEAKEWDATLTLVDGWLQKNPKSLDARLTEGRAAVQNRKAKRAENALREAGVLAPNDARPDALMAELREAQGETGAALEAVDEGGRQGPQQPAVPRAPGLLALAGRAARRGPKRRWRRPAARSPTRPPPPSSAS